MFRLKLGDGAAALVILVGVFIVAAKIVDRPWWPVGRFWAPTEYASEYKESRFQSVREGMSADEVFKRVGPPLEISDYDSRGKIYYEIDPTNLRLPLEWIGNPRHNLYLYYSKQADATLDYFRRFIIISYEGKVDTVVSDYYVD